MSTELETKLQELEQHHVEQNRIKGRPEKQSTTLRIVRECIALASLPQQDVAAGRSVPSPVGQAQQDSDVLGDAEDGPRAAGVPFAEDGGTGSSLAAPSPAIAPAHKPLICQQCYVPFQSPDHGGMAWLHDRQNTIDPDGPCECKCHGLFADTLSNQ